MMRAAGLALVLIASAAPLAAAQQSGMAAAVAMLVQADRNHDGALTQAELERFRRSKFEQLDVDHDTRLTTRDVPMWGLVMGDAGAQAAWSEWSSTLDANHNGSLSLQEFVHGPSPVFDLLDRNHDGAVDAAEFAAAPH